MERLGLLRGRLAIKYIFWEMLPSFILGNVVFATILLMFQTLRLTELLIAHGVNALTVIKIVLYLSISFLPMILPMSLLFSVLLTYGRLSGDSEVVAFKALGLDLRHIALPAFLLSFLTFIFSAQTSFYLAPWGNRQFELLITELGRMKASAGIKEGVFSQGFFDLVIYANKVNSKNGELSQIFIYDERNSQNPFTIIAQSGQIISEVTGRGQLGLLRLNNGNIHRSNNKAYTRVDFGTYDINLFNPLESEQRKKSYLSLTIDEVQDDLKRPDLEPERRIPLQIEWHRRWALSVGCIIFAMIGVGLGTTTNRRAARGGGFVLSVSVVVFYWLLYVTLEGLAKKSILPVGVALWSVNLIFFAFGLRFLMKARA